MDSLSRFAESLISSTADVDHLIDPVRYLGAAPPLTHIPRPADYLGNSKLPWYSHSSESQYKSKLFRINRYAVPSFRGTLV
ncbi:hypothetical protein C8J56DRAFT_1043365 [Mycena floridula]|nr:hypothetical protein C8J56DRAFT_1043365 [Mycena floridula]